MKNIKFFFIVILLFSVLKYGFCETIPVKSNITQVTVFLSGAQVTHSASVTLPAGNSDLVFEDLPQNIDQNSIQVKGGGNFTILSVSQQINFLKDRLKPANIILMEDSLKALQERIDLETNFQHILTEEESLLYTNKSIGNKDIGVDALDLEEMANFFRKRLTDIRNKIIESKLKVKKYSELTAKLNNQLAELNVRHNKPTTEIIISVSSKTKIQAKIQAGYLVYNCGWTPVYDIRTVSSESKKISLVYKANIYQNSGLDWNNVNLTLSTGNPVQSGIRPELRPWILQFRQPVVYYEGAKEKAAYRKAEIPQAAQAFESDISKNDDFNTIQAQTASSYTQATESRVATEFSIGVPYTVPSDGKPHLAEIQNYNVQAQFRYYTAPKIDKDAFLLARIIGWEELNLLPGEANIFNEETYVGKSFISTGTNDTLEISFGRDKSVAVKRTSVKDFTGKKIIGLNKTETHAWEIEIRNTKKDTIEIVAEDQIPVSSDKEITVEPIDKGNALYDEITGKLYWKMKLAPAEVRKNKFMFSVKYPKDKVIPNL